MSPTPAPTALPIGPGRLIVVVGPSGAGKDTLIGLARAELAPDSRVIFPKRVITRPSSSAEDNDAVASASFDATAAGGGFAFWWEAHGLKYALPAAVDDDIRAGRTVVCNVSRAVVASLRGRYADVVVVLVTAPPDVLRGRLAGRGRGTDGDIGARMDRSAAVEDAFRADVTIENVGDARNGARQLAELIRHSAD